MAEATPKYKYPNLASALAAFQADIPKISKSSTADAGSYKYKYTPLDKLVAEVLPKLSAVGLAYTAAPHVDESGEFVLKAQLVHESGEVFGGNYPLGKSTAPAQSIGSVISYARRYALLSLTGVAPDDEDDDGAAGQEAAGSTRKAAAPKAAPAGDTIESVREEISAILGDEDNGVTGEDANSKLAELSKTTDVKQWTLAHYKKTRDFLLAEAKKNREK